MSTVILGSNQIKGVLNMKYVIDIVEKVLQDHGNGKVIMPPKINLNLGERGEWPAYWGSCNSMPAYVHSLNAMGIKFATDLRKILKKVFRLS